MIVNTRCVYIHVVHSLVESPFTEHREFVETLEWHIRVALMAEVSNEESVYGEITFRIDRNSITLKIDKCEENVNGRPWRSLNDQSTSEARSFEAWYKSD